MLNDELVSYFNGDMMAAQVWTDKYALKDKNGNILEKTPDDMHRRLAREFAKIEKEYVDIETSNNIQEVLDDLSSFGKKLYEKRTQQTIQDIENEFFFYFDKFRYIIPQGSIMFGLGNPYVVTSLSNCFTIKSPYDSYSGILYSDSELVNIMKRRGGVGTRLDTLRPENANVTNAAKSSTGIVSFAERYSNSTREVALNGRRGALMLLLSVNHPDIFKFVTMKKDRTKVTGANVSVILTDKFMEAAINDKDFLCTFPTNISIDDISDSDLLEYNRLYTYTNMYNNLYCMKIKAKELFELIVDMAHDNGEPGVAFEDNILDYSPDGVYEDYKPTLSNPCSEIWMSPYDACRLIAVNLFSFVTNKFTEDSFIDYDKMYEVFYMQQRLGDNLVDLEIEYVDSIINKIILDPEPDYIKQSELDLWIKIKNKAVSGRRTGSGLTGLADMLAAINKSYNDSSDIIKKVIQTKFKAELDCTIDMAILRGKFIDCDSENEYYYDASIKLTGKNKFYETILYEFPNLAEKMIKYGRRNVNWSTVAPTGTVSIMTQTTSGLEPVFKAFYTRRVKIVGEDKRVDFIDQNGDKWTEYNTLHPKFKDWIQVNSESLLGIKGEVDFALLEKYMLDTLFKQSPWFNNEANDINWEKRVEIQSIIQKYTSNAISSTVNLPNNVSKETVKNIYISAWKLGLKGITVYRDGCRTGVLVTETANKPVKEQFGYNDAPKRPKELEADYHYVTANGRNYAVIVGLLNGNPYEVFVFENPLLHNITKGIVSKLSTGVYKFNSSDYTIDNLQLESKYVDEKLLTRWVSMMLRHGVSPKYIAQQVEKSEVSIISFSMVLIRVLKSYILDEVITGKSCPSCGNNTLKYQEGCVQCTSCGYSKC